MPIELARLFIGENVEKIVLTIPAFLFIIGQITNTIFNINNRKKFTEYNYRSLILKSFYISYFINFLFLSCAYHIIYQLSNKTGESIIMAVLAVFSLIIFLICFTWEEIKRIPIRIEIGINKLIIFGLLFGVLYIYIVYLNPIIIHSILISPKVYIIYSIIIFNFILLVYFSYLVIKSPEKKANLIFFIGVFDILCAFEFLLVFAIITQILRNDIYVGIRWGIIVTIIIFLCSIISDSNNEQLLVS